MYSGINKYNVCNKPQYHSNISFDGYKSVFSKKLEQALQNASNQAYSGKEISYDFAKLYPKKSNPKNLLGKGSHGSVYRIDDYYVFKVSSEKPVKIGDFQKPAVVSKYSDLKLYYGDVIAKFGNVEIIKNALAGKKSVNAGVPYDVKDWNDILRIYREKYLPAFTSLPQKAFDAIAEHFKKLNQKSNGAINYRFDTNNPNNFIKIGSQIRIIDDISITPVKDFNSPLEMLNVFVIKHKLGTKNIFDEKAVYMRKDLFKKCILASEKAELPYTSIEYKFVLDEYNEACKLSGIDKSFKEIYERLMNFRNIPDMKIRLSALKEYLNSL